MWVVVGPHEAATYLNKKKKSEKKEGGGHE